MRLRRGLMTGAVLVCGLAAAAVPAAAGPVARAVPATGQAAPYCGITWGSGPRAGSGAAGPTGVSPGVVPAVQVRTGRHDCYDRVVFEVTGPGAGYRVAYGEAYTQGRGLALAPYTAGGALLDVLLLGPVDQVRGGSATPAATGDHLARVLGYNTLRDLVYGGSFEGYTTVAVGVRARLPYRVFTLAGPGTHSRIVIDVAHRWTA